MSVRTVFPVALGAAMTGDAAWEIFRIADGYKPSQSTDITWISVLIFWIFWATLWQVTSYRKDQR